MPYSYIVFRDVRFDTLARREAWSIFGRAGMHRAAGAESTRFFRADSDADPDAVRASSHRNVSFIEGVAIICTSAERDDQSILRALASVLDRARPFRLEALNAGSGEQRSAKDIEVRFGVELERMGFTAKLSGVADIVYLIITRAEALVCTPVCGMSRLDAFRRERQQRTISRSEFKLEEALEAFGIDTAGVGRALDIGAAPGGWTARLLGLGIRVIAVDTALLEYSKLGTTDIVVSAESTNPSYGQLSKFGVRVVSTLGSADSGHLLLHIAKPAGMAMAEVSELASSSKFGMLLIDANVDPEEAAGIAMGFASFLRQGAPLLLTIKLVSNKVSEYITAMESGLAASFGGILVRKLPHNRNELTLFAVKK